MRLLAYHGSASGPDHMLFSMQGDVNTLLNSKPECIHT